MDLAARRFPSATIEQSDAIYDGRLRPILVARIRIESTAAIVEFAQTLCLAFAQRFVGIEVGGRYIRVYADYTSCPSRQFRRMFHEPRDADPWY